MFAVGRGTMLRVQRGRRSRFYRVRANYVFLVRCSGVACDLCREQACSLTDERRQARGFIGFRDRICGIPEALPNRSNCYGVRGIDGDRASTFDSGLTIVFSEDNLNHMRSLLLNLSLLLLPT